MRSGIDGPPNLQEEEGVAADGTRQKTKPMSKRPPRQAGDRIPLRLSRKLVAIPRDNQEVLDIDANSLAVAPPKRSDRVQQKG